MILILFIHPFFFRTANLGNADIFLDQKIIFEEKLRARIITEKNKGHFTADDGVKTLPSALNAVLEL